MFHSGGNANSYSSGTSTPLESAPAPESKGGDASSAPHQHSRRPAVALSSADDVSGPGRGAQGRKARTAKIQGQAASRGDKESRGDKNTVRKRKRSATGSPEEKDTSQDLSPSALASVPNGLTAGEQHLPHHC